MKIDTHTHIWDSLELTKEGQRYVPSYLFTKDNLENTMKEHKIEKAVLVQPSFLGNDNSLLIKTVTNDPNKYRGVIVLDDFDTYSNIESLFNRYNIIGIKGIRFNLIGKKLPNFKEKRYLELFSTLKRLNWHLEIHANEDDICTLFKDFKNNNLKVVLDHFARPLKENYNKEFISILNNKADFYIKLSGSYRFNNYKIDNYIKTLISTIGINKLLWGSDCPFTKFEENWKYQQSINLLKKNKLTCQFLEILDKNAQELFDWK